MEAFPSGGYFAGRNFVFDERVTVAGGSGRVVGSCCMCAAPHDTYEPRCRCGHCRMLVLVCPTCASHVRAHPFVLVVGNTNLSQCICYPYPLQPRGCKNSRVATLCSPLQACLTFGHHYLVCSVSETSQWSCIWRRSIWQSTSGPATSGLH